MNILKSKWAPWVALAILTIGYAFAAFWNLGSLHVPQTYWQNQEGDSVVLDLGREHEISRINLFIGRAQGRYYVEKDGDGPTIVYYNYAISTSLDGVNWTEKTRVGHDAWNQFKWRTSDINTGARYIRVANHSMKEGTNPHYVDSQDGKVHQVMLNEIAVYDKNKNLIPIAHSTVPQVVDEQKYAVYESNVSNSTYFDECYHVRTAFEILHKQPIFENTHPPLGKVFIAFGIWLFGMVPFGWRFMGTLAGVLMIPALFLLARQLFKKDWLALVAASLFAFDFMHFSLTRIATIDSYPVLFIILTFYFLAVYADKLKNAELSVKQKFTPLWWSGVMFGLACGSKWIGFYIAFGILAVLAYLWWREHKTGKNKLKTKRLIINHVLMCVLAFFVIPAGIYFCSYLPQIRYVEKEAIRVTDKVTGQRRTTGKPSAFGMVWNNQTSMLSYHGNLKADHPFSSKPVAWPFGQRPLWAYSNSDAAPRGNTEIIWFHGTPLIWLLGLFAVIGVMCMGFMKRKRNFVIAFISFGFLTNYLVWLLVPRLAFIYHFFASVPWIILAICYWLDYQHTKIVGKGKNKEEKVLWSIPKWVWIVIPALALLLFILWFPRLAGVEISTDFSNKLNDWYKTLTFHGIFDKLK
ncbi:MAG: phospholipid carrier-dependent glycosyltransferase [Oscillospiraceae bacterium]|nr:phospholipid carrier-dependent glycosyltransferase [Oscillospiraceae bacterium]